MSRRAWPAALAAGVIGLLGGPGELRAQEPEPEVVPREFVLALVPSFWFSGGVAEPRLLVGSLPEPLSDLPLPEGWRVIGGIDWGGRATGAVATDTDPASAAQRWRELLASAGFELARPPEQPGFGGAGPSSATFCSDRYGISFNTRGVPGAGAQVTFVRHRQEGSACSSDWPPPGARHGSVDSPIPTMSLPDGVVLRGSGSGGGGREWSAHATLLAPLPLDRLFEHYEGRLLEEGWEPLSRSVEDALAAGAFRVPDAEGGWLGVLTLAREEEGSVVQAHLRLVREDPAP